MGERIGERGYRKEGRSKGIEDRRKGERGSFMYIVMVIMLVYF